VELFSSFFFSFVQACACFLTLFFFIISLVLPLYFHFLYLNAKKNEKKQTRARSKSRSSPGTEQRPRRRRQRNLFAADLFPSTASPRGRGGTPSACLLLLLLLRPRRRPHLLLPLLPQDRSPGRRGSLSRSFPTRRRRPGRSGKPSSGESSSPPARRTARPWTASSWLRWPTQGGTR